MSKPVLDKILACPKLPSLPSVAMQVLELTRAEQVDLGEVASVVQNDQALAMKVLRTVNSSYYGLAQPCVSIQQALVYLGLSAIKTIVLGFSLTDNLGQSGDEEASFDYLDYWRRGLFSAAAARQIAATTDAWPAEEVFLGALLQDLGMVAMYRALEDQYTNAIELTEGDHAKLQLIEKRVFDLDHAEVGAAIAKRWDLPEQVVETIRFHHNSDAASPKWRVLVRTVELGRQAALSLTDPDQNEAISTFSENARQWFELSEEQIRSVLHNAGKEAAELSALFNLHTSKQPDVDTILQMAEERLVEHQMEMEREKQELKRTNEALSKQALSDPLTGLANRKCFDQCLAERFEQATSFNAVLGLIFCDLDRFKSVNDTYGHQIGDAVLGQTARLMQEQIGDSGVVARYGGEEFAIILPGSDRVATAKTAERLRLAVAETPVNLRNLDGSVDELSVTLSLGVAAYEASTADLLTKPERLVRVADQAVYAAKGAGRNCVRVFSPVRKPPRAA